MRCSGNSHHRELLQVHQLRHTQNEVERTFARDALTRLAAAGLDVTQPLFAGKEHGFPDYGMMGAHITGFYASLARPPLTEEANRLWERFAQLRQHIPTGPAAKPWFDSLADAVGEFHSYGDLPQDPLLADTVLADCSFRALLCRYFGRETPNPPLLAAIDAMSAALGEDRDAAIAALQSLIRQSGWSL